MLCHEINGKPLGDVGNIVEISRAILDKFPKIIEDEIESVFAGLKPLTEWKVSADSKGNEKVDGLEWWKVYTSIKHNGAFTFDQGNLRNAVTATASLYVIELYLMKMVNGNTLLSSKIKPEYYSSRYGLMIVGGKERALPDFDTGRPKGQGTQLISLN